MLRHALSGAYFPSNYFVKRHKIYIVFPGKQSDTQIPQDVMFLLKSVRSVCALCEHTNSFIALSFRVFGHFEKPLFMELCKHVETKFVPAGAILFRPGQVALAHLHAVLSSVLILSRLMTASM